MQYFEFFQKPFMEFHQSVTNYGSSTFFFFFCDVLRDMLNQTMKEQRTVAFTERT